MDGLEVPARSIRIDDERWELFGSRLRKEPDQHLRSRSAMIRAFIDFYTGQVADAYAILPPEIKLVLSDDA